MRPEEMREGYVGWCSHVDAMATGEDAVFVAGMQGALCPDLLDKARSERHSVCGVK